MSCKKKGDDDSTPEPFHCESGAPIVLKEGSGKLTLPDAFTPNGDGKNDIFRPVFTGIDENNYELLITLGSNNKLIFKSTNILQGWTGTADEGAACEPGRYALTIRFRTTEGIVKDTCNYITLLATDPVKNCILTHGFTYHFGDEIDVQYPDKGCLNTTAEVICRVY